MKKIFTVLLLFIVTLSTISFTLLVEEEVSLDEQIAQMIMMGIHDRKNLKANDTLREEIKSKMGGIILFEKNISSVNSYDSLKKLVASLQAASSTPLFMAIDEEGGRVHRLKEKYGFVGMPSAQYLGTLNNTDSTYYYAERLAAQMEDLGFNLNFAPTVDVAINPNNPIIALSKRSYSNDAEKVAQHALAFNTAMHQHNIKTTLKHFPGHGSSSGDTHKGLVDVTKQWKEEELIPYKRIFASGDCDALLSCHVVNCNLDTACWPCTMSNKVTTQLLRNDLKFEGVVFSDDMQMDAISKMYGMEKSIKMAINAGVDVLVFGNNVVLSRQTSATKVHSIIKKLVLSGEISRERITQSYNRIMALKNKKSFSLNELTWVIDKITKSANAKVGVAISYPDRLITVNSFSNDLFPTFSVIKFPLAAHILHLVDENKLSLDKSFHFEKNKLNKDTYSPLRDDAKQDEFDLTLQDLLRYAVSQSDNIAYEKLVELGGGLAELKAYINQSQISGFSIADNGQNYAKNMMSPQASNDLLIKVFKGSILSKESLSLLQNLMTEAVNGSNRIKGLLPAGTLVAHKTGTDGTDEKGINQAFNDVGVVTLPNGQQFFISVFITNSRESDENNAKIIAEISKAAWDYFVKKGVEK